MKRIKARDQQTNNPNIRSLSHSCVCVNAFSLHHRDFVAYNHSAVKIVVVFCSFRLALSGVVIYNSSKSLISIRLKRSGGKSVPETVVMLVSCGKRKSTKPCQAKEMYNSSRFQCLKSIAEQFGLEWYILSAKYGLLSPNEVIEPYDLSLAMCPLEEQISWAVRTANQLLKADNDTAFFIVADALYSQHIVPMLHDAGHSVSAPFLDQNEVGLASYVERATHLNDIRRLYDLLFYLSDSTGGVRRICDCNGKMYWPQRGVYFVVDFGEQNLILHGRPRIVRIGTHAVSRDSKSTLWNRIKTHKGTDSGSGNHRGSIFRLHVGNAIIKQQGIICNTWGVGQNASKAVRSEEIELEKQVSKYIGNLGIIVLDVDDEPSANSIRSFVEKNSISLLSSINSSFNFPMIDWLGNYSNREEIRKSALWNINYVNSTYDESLLDVVERHVAISVQNYKKG